MQEKIKEIKPRRGSLVGRWFHSFQPNETNWPAVKWQGQIVAKPGRTRYLVQLYSWAWGEASHQQFVELDDMKDWYFYDSSEEMNYNYEHRLQNRKQ